MGNGEKHTRKIIIHLIPAGNARIEGIHQLIVEHLLRVIEDLAEWIGLKRRLGSDRIGKQQRQPRHELPTESFPVQLFDLGLPLRVNDFREVVQWLSKLTIPVCTLTRHEFKVLKNFERRLKTLFFPTLAS